MPRQQVITGNRLDDGRVVYLDANGDWRTALRRAQLFADIDAARTAVGSAAAAVVEAYAIEVESGDDGPLPVAMRERLRALGPSRETGREAGREEPLGSTRRSTRRAA